MASYIFAVQAQFRATRPNQRGENTIRSQNMLLPADESKTKFPIEPDLILYFQQTPKTKAKSHRGDRGGTKSRATWRAQPRFVREPSPDTALLLCERLS